MKFVQFIEQTNANQPKNRILKLTQNAAQGNHSAKACCGFVVAAGDRSKLFKFAKTVFHGVAGAINNFVVIFWLDAILAIWNNRLNAFLYHKIPDFIVVVALVGYDLQGF